MNSTKFIGIILITVALIFRGHDTISQPNFNGYSVSELAESGLLNFSPEDVKKLEVLTKKMADKGYNISPIILDNRFELYNDIDNFFKKSAERKSIDLSTYKRILGFEAKKKQGGHFVQTHLEQLKKAEEKYNISRYIITAILGIESDFGKNVGSHNPFNVYVSMYVVGYRADFAEAQLLELLKFTRKNNIDIFKLKSSYAGAVSYAQFIPYSLNKWFVGDDIENMEHNIMSVANYLAYFEKRTKSLRTTILRYNPSGLYADAVLELAGELEDAISGTP